MKILLATDGSAFSDAAVEEVARHSWPEASELKIIYVIEPFVPPTTDTWVMPSDYYDQLIEAAECQAREAVGKAAARISTVTGEMLRVSTEIINGHPKQAIVGEAEKWCADLIVVGSHGDKGLTKFLLGSVSQAVVSHAGCSVEVAQSRTATEG